MATNPPRIRGGLDDPHTRQQQQQRQRTTSAAVSQSKVDRRKKLTVPQSPKFSTMSNQKSSRIGIDTLKRANTGVTEQAPTARLSLLTKARSDYPKIPAATATAAARSKSAGVSRATNDSRTRGAAAGVRGLGLAADGDNSSRTKPSLQRPKSHHIAR